MLRMTSPSAEDYYGSSPVCDRIKAALAELGVDSPTLDDLAGIDHFHNAGVRATAGLAELGELSSSDYVLDVGAGMAGPARWLMANRGCSVVCIDIAEEFCEAARVLNAATGYAPEIIRGDMLDLEFADDTFDVVWAQNAFMNIADKARLFAEMRRVLKGSGRLVFQEVMAGPNGPALYPVPWADSPAISHLEPPADYRNILQQHGFAIRAWEDRSEWASSLPPPPSRPGLEVWLPDVEAKVSNARQNAIGGRTLLWWGVAQKSVWEPS
jgi:ubiquinone/menaquinone biosynthesis C-methylase UbiE